VFLAFNGIVISKGIVRTFMYGVEMESLTLIRRCVHPGRVSMLSGSSISGELSLLLSQINHYEAESTTAVFNVSCLVIVE
jgi:hypothetical protein